MSCRSSNETDNISALELQSNRRMLYFSDGVMEELSSSDSEPEADVPDKSCNIEINKRELPLGPRLRYTASKMGTNILAGIDYVGGGLASFLGITSSKYASELEHYKRAKEHDAANAADEDLENWQHPAAAATNSNNINNNQEAVVLCEPRANPLPPSRQ